MKVSIIIPLIKYCWFKMMASFWGKIAEMTNPNKMN